MMRVSAADVSAQFDALISGRRSPEDVEQWATARMVAEDAGELAFEPPAEAERLWDAILYLLGVGLRVGPGEYLHSRADFEGYRQVAGL
jgi:hypothetical protein